MGTNIWHYIHLHVINGTFRRRYLSLRHKETHCTLHTSQNISKKIASVHLVLVAFVSCLLGLSWYALLVLLKLLLCLFKPVPNGWNKLTCIYVWVDWWGVVGIWSHSCCLHLYSCRCHSWVISPPGCNLGVFLSHISQSVNGRQQHECPKTQWMECNKMFSLYLLSLALYASKIYHTDGPHVLVIYWKSFIHWKTLSFFLILSTQASE